VGDDLGQRLLGPVEAREVSPGARFIGSAPSARSDAPVSRDGRDADRREAVVRQRQQGPLRESALERAREQDEADDRCLLVVEP
jgi:hypothetical protein